MTTKTNLVNFNILALEAAQKSPCQKRKVGAVVVGKDPRYYATGFNYSSEGLPCEEKGITVESVIHAEESALKSFRVLQVDKAPLEATEGCYPHAIYVTQPPCSNCLKAIKAAGIESHNIHVVSDFMKFDAGKLQFGLIPPEATTALAEVLTFGAKKYKPNNWRKGEIVRYIDAAYRHWEAYRGGEWADQESGISHLSHLLTNIAFLIVLDNEDKLKARQLELDF